MVTGSSSGIGREIARELAKDGCDLVLTARRLDRLKELKGELESRHPIEVMVIQGDLADPSTPQALYRELAAADKRINFLVNNAGYGNPRTYLDSGWIEHASLIQVMLTSACELTHLLLPSMVAEGYGRIINVASMAGYLPGTFGNTLYGASKSFLIKFTESLSLELENSGVKLCAVCPGFTYSEFHDVTGTRAALSWLPGFMWMDANTVARQSIKAVNQGRVVYINGVINRLVLDGAKLLPQRAALEISRRRSKMTE
ncbi:MAG: SDR family oxidoreductase [Deltaproteobacteria bacterium]|nr:SDR family oxidoreductase [Deltaproteobacteria bacterium]